MRQIAVVDIEIRIENGLGLRAEDKVGRVGHGALMMFPTWPHLTISTVSCGDSASRNSLGLLVVDIVNLVALDWVPFSL